MVITRPPGFHLGNELAEAGEAVIPEPAHVEAAHRVQVENGDRSPLPVGVALRDLECAAKRWIVREVFHQEFPIIRSCHRMTAGVTTNRAKTAVNNAKAPPIAPS
jgi:hypothetical protein